MFTRDVSTGSVVPVAVRRAISTDNFRLNVCNSVNEIGFLFEEGDDEDEDEEGDEELDEDEEGEGEGDEDEDEGEDEEEDEDEDEDEDEEEEEDEGEEKGEDEGEGLDDTKPSISGETRRASFCRKRTFCPISSTSCTVREGGLYSFAAKKRSSALTVW
jgi:hypothetical protein